MSKRQWLSVFGVWVIVFLFLGFPSTWQRPIAIATGLIIIAIAYNLPHEQNTQKTDSSNSFVENNSNNSSSNNNVNNA